MTPWLGTSSALYYGDAGPSRDAIAYEPSGLATDGSGSIYVSDRVLHRVRVITSNGTIYHVAGS